MPTCNRNRTHVQCTYTLARGDNTEHIYAIQQGCCTTTYSHRALGGVSPRGPGNPLPFQRWQAKGAAPDFGAVRLRRAGVGANVSHDPPQWAVRETGGGSSGAAARPRGLTETP